MLPRGKKHSHGQSADFMKQWSRAVVRTLPAPPGVRPKPTVQPLPAPPHQLQNPPTNIPSSGKRTRRGIDRKRAANLAKKSKSKEPEVVVIESDSEESGDDDREWSNDGTSTSEAEDPREKRGLRSASKAQVTVDAKTVEKNSQERDRPTAACAQSNAHASEPGSSRARVELKPPPLGKHTQKDNNPFVTSRGIDGTVTNNTEKDTPRENCVTTSVKIHNLLERRKLRLILDLDHTLLNSATVEDCVVANAGMLLDGRVAAEAADDPKKKSLHRLGELGLWTKTRPGVDLFLKKASALFEIHICTAGSQAYAEKMRAILDPRKELVKGSVVGLASFDRFGAPRPGEVVKTMERELIGSEAIAIVLDDTPHVWPGHADNLIVCERYVYFPSCARRFGMLTPSLLERRVDESADRGMLATAFDVLQRVHSDFFARRAAQIAFLRKQLRDAETAENASDGIAHALDDASSDEDNVALTTKKESAREREPRTEKFQIPSGNSMPITVPQLLTLEKQRVLLGTELVFSGVVPSNTDPSLHPLWRLAQAFGARCAHQPSDATTTHVVVEPANLGPGGTDKMIWAFGKNIHVVTPGWVLTSAASFQRADEEAFTVRQ